MPSPVGLVVKNGVNSFARTSGDTPTPLSRTRTSTCSPRSRRRHPQSRAIIRTVAVFALALGRRIEAIPEQVEKHARDVLRYEFDRPEIGIEVALQRDVEVLILSAGPVVGEIERLLDQRIEVDGLALAAAAARMQQHALHDAVGPPPVLGNLGQVAGQRRDQILQASASASRFEPVHGRAERLLELVQQLLGQAGEVVDEVQRVLDLVRDAGGQLAERSHFLGVDEVGLRGLQLAIGLLHRPARFGGGIAGRLQLAFALSSRR